MGNSHPPEIPLGRTAKTSSMKGESSTSYVSNGTDAERLAWLKVAWAAKNLVAEMPSARVATLSFAARLFHPVRRFGDSGVSAFRRRVHHISHHRGLGNAGLGIGLTAVGKAEPQKHFRHLVGEWAGIDHRHW